MPSALIGRSREAETLRTHLTTASRSARLVVLEGEPGVGKTSLLEAVTLAIPATSQVVRARGLHVERERPFGAMADALHVTSDLDEPRRRSILALLTGEAEDSEVAATSPGDVPMLWFRVVNAMVDLVAALTAEQPVVLLVEDLHWMDDASQQLIEQLARRLADRPLTIVVTTRPTSRSPVLDAIRSELTNAGVLHLRLEPLSDEDVRTIATGRLGATPGPGLTEVLGRAAGNPLYVTELLAALLADDAVHVLDGIAEVSAPEVPVSLDMTILARLGYVPVECLEVLRIATLLGSRFTLDDLSIIIDRPVSELLQVLEVPLTVGLLEDVEFGVAFRHDLVRDAVYRDVPGEARRALHMQAARRLAAAGRSPTQVAPHFLAGARQGDTEAIAWLGRAGKETLPRSPAIAAELLEGAIAICGPEHVERDELLVTLLIALAWAGRNIEAADLAAELETRPHEERLAAQSTLATARTLHMLGREREALERYGKVVDSHALTEQQRALVVADIASAAIMVGALDDARRAADDACERGRRTGNDPALCGGLSALCYVASAEGRTLDAIALGEEARRVARDSPDRATARRYPQGYLGLVLMDADRLEEGSRIYDEGRRVAEEMGDRYQAPIYDFGRMLAEFYAGRLDDAEVALEASMEAAREVGFTNLLVWSQTLAARIAIRRDELDRAAGLLDEADAEIARVGPRVGFDWLLWCRALLSAAAGDLPSALETLRTAWEMSAGLGLISQGRLIAPDLVRMLMTVGDADSAAAIVASTEHAAEVGGTNIGRAVALRCRGMLDSDLVASSAAVDLYRSSPRELERADAMRDHGTLLTAGGRGDDASPVLQEALALYVARGAVRDQRDTEAMLRGLGVTVGRRGTRGRPAFGWDALTPTELEVARLAADGLSNPEIARRRFVSPRTIESHLSSAFIKLNVSSRVALAAEVVRRSS